MFLSALELITCKTWISLSHVSGLVQSPRKWALKEVDFQDLLGHHIALSSFNLKPTFLALNPGFTSYALCDPEQDFGIRSLISTCKMGRIILSLAN